MAADKQLTKDDERLLALEECEMKIKNAARRGLDATVTVGGQLEKIRIEELYLARVNDFVAYVENFVGVSRSTAARMIEVAKGVSGLQSERLPLPENESQVLELVKVGASERGHIWQRTIELCARAEQPVTANRIRLVIRSETEKEEEAKTLAGEGVQVDLDGFGPLEQAHVRASAPPPAKQMFSEEGERALDRIGRLCGEPVQRAIETQTLPLAQRDVIKWAGQDDELVRNLAYYIIDLRWSVTQAINYERKIVSGATTLDELTRYCLARGGKISLLYEGIRIILQHGET